MGWERDLVQIQICSPFFRLPILRFRTLSCHYLIEKQNSNTTTNNTNNNNNKKTCNSSDSADRVCKLFQKKLLLLLLLFSVSRLPVANGHPFLLTHLQSGADVSLGGSYMGFGASLGVNIDSFRSRDSYSQSFGSHREILQVGSEAMPEPIRVDLVSIDTALQVRRKLQATIKPRP